MIYDLKNKNLKQTSITAEIDENNIRDEKCFEKFKSFNNEKGVTYTEFELEEIDFSIKIKIINQNEISILSLFNLLTIRDQLS